MLIDGHLLTCISHAWYFTPRNRVHSKRLVRQIFARECDTYFQAILLYTIQVDER